MNDRTTSKDANPEGPIELSILMPCLNEAETLATCIMKAQRALSDLAIKGEVVVADNGSTDGSPDIASRAGARVVHVPAKGYGSALLGGIEAARGQYIIMGDADDSYDFADLRLFVDKLREGYDLVMGNRFKGGIKPGAMPPLHQYLGNPVLSAIGRLLFHSPVGDFHCGLRGFNKDAITKLDLRTTGMEFASEMVVKATLQRLRIAEVPTILWPDGRNRPPHLRSWRDGWRHLRFLLLYSPRWLWLYPGVAMIVLGCLVLLWLLPGPRHVSGIEFDIHTMLYAAIAIVLGFQAVQFYIFAKEFAIGEGLLPPDPELRRLTERFSLEVGLVAGSVLLAVGMAGSLAAALIWGYRSFPALVASQTMRFVIPFLLLVTVGCQLVFGSFFLGVLRLQRR